MRAWVLFLASIILAGCAGTPAPEADGRDAHAPQEGLAFRLSTLDGCACANEPSVAVDGKGRIFASWYGGSGMAVSNDGGQTLITVDAPSLPPGTPPQSSRADDTVFVGPTDRLYYVAMVLTGAVAVGGLQVAASDDGAQTWLSNVYLSASTLPSSAAPMADRPWLVFPSDEEVLLIYGGGYGSGIYLQRSTDGGRTFDLPKLAVPPPGRNYVGPSGQPVVDANGRLYIPYFADLRTEPGVVGTRTVRVAISEDGESFVQRQVFSHPPGEGSLNGFFPSIAVTGHAGLVVGWTEGGGSVLAALSEDGGTTWSAPFRLSREEDPAHYLNPWLAARSGGGVDALWFSAGSDGPSDLVLARYGPGVSPDPAADAVAAVAEGLTSTNTDFPHFAHLPDGRAVVVWIPEAGTLRLAVETRPPGR